MRRATIVFGILFFAALLGWGLNFYWKNLRGIGPALKNPPEDITRIIPPFTREQKNTIGFSLSLPEGFSLSIFAKDLPGARVMTRDASGNMWVSQTAEGTISRLEMKDGKVIGQRAMFQGLRKPHGLAFDPKGPNTLFIAEENRISRVVIGSGDSLKKILDLPYGKGHFTRTIGFGPDGRLYVSIGSSCNVCIEKDSRRAKIFSLNTDGSDLREFARGLRNAVFFTWHPQDKKMWATEMGRDYLGDDLPPDEINIIEENPTNGLKAKNYGWPNCYGKNIHDRAFDKNTYIRNPCEEPFEMPSFVDLPAHSAPLGLAFVPTNSQWPKEYWHNLFVAYHGSWNRSAPTGYKVVRIKLDAEGNYLGREDFITGWLQKDGALGRPVDILVRSEGVMYISDDKAGVIYQVTHQTFKK